MFLRRLLALNSGRKSISGKNRAQNISHRPDYLASDAGYIPLACMDLMRVWPSRYCPACGGLVRVARRGYQYTQSWRVGIASSGELVGVLAIVAGGSVGGVVGHFLGALLGFLVGVSVGLGVLCAVAAFLIRSEKEGLVCQCSDCHKQFTYGQCEERRPHDQRTD